jgi:hypothetical protein
MGILTAPLAGPRKWYEIWRDVWFHPGARTFQSVLEREVDVSYKRGFMWVALTALIFGLIDGFNTSGLLSGNTTNTDLTASPVIVLCGALIVAPIVAIVGVIISAGIYHGIAKLFRGKGDWGKLAFCFAAVEAPLLLLASTIVILSSIFPPMAELFSCLNSGISGMSLFLYGSAISAVEGFGTGKTIVTVLIPVILVVVLIVLIAIFSGKYL